MGPYHPCMTDAEAVTSTTWTKSVHPTGAAVLGFVPQGLVTSACGLPPHSWESQVASRQPLVRSLSVQRSPSLKLTHRVVRPHHLLSVSSGRGHCRNDSPRGGSPPASSWLPVSLAGDLCPGAQSSMSGRDPGEKHADTGYIAGGEVKPRSPPGGKQR